MNKAYIVIFLTLPALLLLACGGEKDVRAESPSAAAVTPKSETLVAQADTPPTSVTATPAKTSLRLAKPETLKRLEESGIYAVENDAIAVLQSPTEALADFPTNRRNEIDWVAALRQGLIAPRASVDGTEQMAPLDMDIIMTDTAAMPYVRFPHQTHTELLACENCHTEIFEPVNNGNPITMGKILNGEYCGRCHDRVAFSLFVCENCHNVPKNY